MELVEPDLMDDRVWKGNPKLEPLLVPIEEITTHPRNPRKGDLPLLAESLDGFGQTRPIVVQPETHYIVAGNHTYRAAVEVLAWTHIAIVQPALEPSEYEQYLLMDNRASDMSEYDDEVMVAILERLQDSGDLAFTGWNEAQIEDFISNSERISRDAEHEFRAGHDEDDDHPEGGRLFKKPVGSANQLMLAYNGDAYQDVVHNLGILRREYGTSGIGPTAARAIANQFDLIFHGTEA